MDFISLKTKEGGEQCVVVSQIGNWSVSKQHCNTCGITHYKLDVYDKKGLSLCSIEGDKTEIKNHSRKIKNAMQHLHLPKIRKKIEVAKPVDIRVSIQRNSGGPSASSGAPATGGAPTKGKGAPANGSGTP